MDKAIVTPVVKLLLQVKTDALLAFLNQMNCTWALARIGGGFRAEIMVKNGGTYLGTHKYIPHNALAHATAEFLIHAHKDFHEYQEKGNE